MNERLLEITDLNVSYVTDDGTFYAVNGLDLSIYKGETLGLVGETGAGKTTTALSIMGLLPERVGHVNSGSIQLEDIDITKASETQLRTIRGNNISMIFQDPMTSLNPVLTIGDQIYEVLELHNKENRSKAELDQAVDEMLMMVGLSPSRKGEYPHQFSGGMKQRVVIAIALACQPQLLLADEPTTALDVTIQAQVLVLMSDLKQRLGTSMLLVTHDLGVVAEICDRVAIMYAGEIVEIGKVENIFAGDFHHPYTVGLFRSIPDISKSTKRLNPIDGLMPDPTILLPGCKFAERCPKAMDVCKHTKPRDIMINEHTVKCHLYQDAGV